MGQNSTPFFRISIVEPMNPRHIAIQPQAGRPLPPDWQRQAAQRKSQAEADYLVRLENAWRNTGSSNPLTDARLTRDSRVDGLLKIEDDEEREVWASAGIRVIRKK